MDQERIFFPVVALATITFAVLLLIPYRRFKAGRSGRVTSDDFKFGESTNVPPDVSIPNRNLMNLLELPILFYVASITLYVTKSVKSTLLLLAWVYVALRAAHSLVHVTYNKVVHRLTLYAASNVVLGMIWVRLFQSLLR
jgi:hypothetical protein